MRCVCDNDLTALNPNGNARAEQLAQAWTNLHTEYIDLIESAEAQYRSRLIGEIMLSELKASHGEGWIALIEQGFLEEFPEAMRIIGFDYDYNPMDKIQLDKDIARTKAELRALRFDIKVKKAQHSAILESDGTAGTSEVVDRKYFHQIFQAINNYHKWNLVNEQSSVLDFCVALKAYQEIIESLKRKTS